MSVLINFKICDNAKECNGIEVCPTGAISWNEKNKTIAIDNNKCTSCGACERACMVGAIKVTKTEGEYKKIKKEINEDPRKVSDLFIDRYGAIPIEPAFLVSEDKFCLEVLEATKSTMVEIFSQKSIMCLRFSIPIKELLSHYEVKYRRIEVKKNSFLLKKYKITKLPSLLLFKDGNLEGKIEGYYDSHKKETLLQKVNKIMGKIS